MARTTMTLHVALLIVSLFTGAARAADLESAAQRACLDTCRDQFLQCMIDGGFEDEAPYQACRTALADCRAACVQKPAWAGRSLHPPATGRFMRARGPADRA